MEDLLNDYVSIYSVAYSSDGRGEQVLALVDDSYQCRFVENRKFNRDFENSGDNVIISAEVTGLTRISDGSIVEKNNRQYRIESAQEWKNQDATFGYKHYASLYVND